MSRPLRIEFPGAVYHVTSRGDRRERIFADDQDRRCLLEVLEQGLERFDAEAVAYCLMGNHYHFVLHTRSANLSLLMRHINGVYSQRFNRRHGLVGHLLQGRFKAVLVDRDAYLLEVCRYVELNPVRAGIVPAAADWAWSSYRAHTGQAESPVWLDVPGVHAAMLGRDALTDADVNEAQSRYARWVTAGLVVRLWDDALRQQVFLGDDAFVQRMQALMSPAVATAPAIPRRQRRSPKGLADWLRELGDRDEALWQAHTQSGLSMTVLAGELGLSVSRVSQILAGRRPGPRNPASEDGAVANEPKSVDLGYQGPHVPFGFTVRSKRGCHDQTH
jgi:REP element-mobilizing transposase RayT